MWSYIRPDNIQYRDLDRGRPLDVPLPHHPASGFAPGYSVKVVLGLTSYPCVDVTYFRVQPPPCFDPAFSYHAVI